LARKSQLTQKPLPPIDDPFLKLLEDSVTAVLQNPEAKPREKATMVAHGIRLAFIKFRIKGPPEGESFF
jgi:hypothetical protein